jgi:hypothetical protein
MATTAAESPRSRRTDRLAKNFGRAAVWISLEGML